MSRSDLIQGCKMNNYYQLTVGNLTRNLPIIELPNGIKIASFVLLGDAELVREVTPLLQNKLPEFDVIVTAEAKGIPIAQSLADALHHRKFYVARKSQKSYMVDPLSIEVNSITTEQTQMLYFDGIDAQEIAGKRVAIIDDVISTGESIKSLESLVEKAGGNVVCRAAILAEGDAKNRDDLIYLEHLPLL